MAKWNPFEKQILNADPEEFAGSGEGGYGVPHDADAVQQSADVVHHPDIAPDDAGAALQDTDGAMQDAGAAAHDMDGTLQDAGAAVHGMDGAMQDAGAAAHDMDGTLQDAGAAVHDMDGTPQDAGAAVHDMDGAMQDAGAAAHDMDGASHGPDAVRHDADEMRQSVSDAVHNPSASSQIAGNAAPDKNAEKSPAGPSGPAFGAKHDFEDDEPKFDTQTGERLDKPKKKFPAMLLTAAVTVMAAGTLVYAVKPGALPSRKEVVEEELVETEKTAAEAAAESEAENRSRAEDLQPETESPAKVQDLQPKTESPAQVQNPQPETESPAKAQDLQPETGLQADAAGQTSAPWAAQTEAFLTGMPSGNRNDAGDRTDTDAGSSQTLPEHSRGGRIGAKAPGGAQTEAQTETEITGRIPPITTDGMTVSASFDVSDMIEKAAPGIVSVTCTSLQSALDFFYGAQEIRQTAAGSGIIAGVDEEFLYLVTDASIVNGAEEITVGFCVQKDQTDGLSDEDTLSAAELVGIDQDSMLAVIRVPLDGVHETVRSLIRPSELGDSGLVRVGEPVIAIGNVLGRGITVTQGIISAVNRPLRYGTSVHDFIQTDASMNNGNYGGALLNEEGEVIGINVGKITEDLSEGMGFAIPSGDVKDVIGRLLPASVLESFVREESEEAGETEETEETQEIRDGEEAQESRDGEKAQEAGETRETEEARESEEAGDASGQTQTKSSEAGTKEEKQQKETLALALAGEETESSSLGEAEQEQSEKARESLSQSEDETPSPAQTEGLSRTPSQGQLGIQVGEFSKEDQIIYRIPAGAVVAHVADGSGAQAAGLAVGDLIIRINDQEISSVAGLKEALQGLKGGDKVLVTYLRPDEDGAYRKEEELSVMVTLKEG